ncbi:uncharacterized protein LOC128546222 isoform X2 [Mercenaria mercenaria]|uniref:uncharacterized protein LOC128546222 isoform X2 n=1 Tax=Mercenaria mercenaria TaxID=6596 RepID=UPI00234EA05A|nr:uncharacterized protein LOC128546222 isoform X2 [Mercenaria mercenaria]
MSVSRHKVRNDRNILFTSKLCCEALVSTLLLYAVPTLLKEGTLCYINQNTVLWGPLPYITDKMGVMIKDTAQKLRNTADSMLFNLFREKRTLVLVQIQFESFVLEQSDVLSVLKSKLTRHISTGVCMTRSVKSTEFLKLLKLNEELVYDKNKNIEPKKYLAEKRNNSNRNGTFWMILESQTDSSRITCEAPRKYVRVDVFRCMSDNKNEIEIPSPKNVLQHIITAYPFHSYKHDLPEMPHEDEKYPVQATEIDAGQLSFGSYRPTIANSIFPNNSQRSDHQRDIQEARRNFNAVTSGTGLQRRTKPARYPDYTALDNRVSSFQTPNWDSNNKPDTLVLVNWGFFYTGTEDLVRCYQCGLGLKDWVKDDDVLQEHVKHSATCDYLLTRLGRETVDQIKISLESPGCSTNTSSAGQLSYKMRSPRYQTMASRLASFKDFPRHIHISHQQLAVAGLFYTGKGDLCRCFTCDGGLKDWSAGDDPIKEHATYFPKCTYINQLKGSEYVRVLQRTRQNEQSTVR